MVQWNKKRRQATFCEMPACNNGSYAVHISHVKWNNGAMHKNYNKMIQTSNGDTVHRNKTRMCHYVMNTKSMCYIIVQQLDFSHGRPCGRHTEHTPTAPCIFHQDQGGKKKAQIITQRHPGFTTSSHKSQLLYKAQNYEHWKYIIK